MMLRLLCGLFVLLFTTLAARAHPVAQGAMDVAVRAGVIEIRARVSNEEAFGLSRGRAALTAAPAVSVSAAAAQWAEPDRREP